MPPHVFYVRKLFNMDLLSVTNIIKNYVVGAEGNLSKRDGNSFIIKASGTRLDSLQIEDLVTCNLHGLNEFADVRRPSMEHHFHSLLYKMNESINYIIHTHPTNVMKIVCSSDIYKFANNRFFPDQVVYNERKSCVVPYGHPGSDIAGLISEYIKKFMSDNTFFPTTILLQNHGLITVGNTLNFCLMATEICEKSAEIFLGTRDINFLDEIEISRLINDKHEHYRKNLG